jgi:predicted RNA binding protein YcfA (HicA-like mRNA interferase family)
MSEPNWLRRLSRCGSVSGVTTHEPHVSRVEAPASVIVKVRDLIRELEAAGWVQVRQVGSHRQFRHPTKPGTVTVPGKASDDVAKGTLGSVIRQAGSRGGSDD